MAGSAIMFHDQPRAKAERESGSGVVCIKTCEACHKQLAERESESGVVRIRPREYSRAFANPLKGFRPDLPSPNGGSSKGLDNPLVSLVRHYIRWNQIEDSATDGVEKIVAFCNTHWAGLERRNIKVIPRVYLYWPPNGYFWPSDLRQGDYGSRRFLHRLEKFIYKLGTAWNRDGRVAFVETGIVGPCGEQWGPTPHYELRKVMGDSYTAAFPDKLCMIRYPWQWPDYQFGVFWDSWGTHKDTARMLDALESPPWVGSWKTRVRGGEISYGFGEPPGENPDDTMTQAHHVDWVECLIRRGHWNHLGWVSEFDWHNSIAAQNAQRLQKAFGYRFVLEEVSYPARVTPSQPFRVAFVVRNTGSTPFYYNWPVELSLLDETTRQPVWRDRFVGVDIRQWLPGDRWRQFAHWDAAHRRYVLDAEPACYEIPAPSNLVEGRFTLPDTLRPGSYLLALAILDPVSNTPACRFAIVNYFAGGRHPLGRLGVDATVGEPELSLRLFDDLTRDNTIRY